MLLNKLILVSSIALSLNAWAAEPVDESDFDAMPPLSSTTDSGAAKPQGTAADTRVQNAKSNQAIKKPDEAPLSLDIHHQSSSVPAKPTGEPVIIRNSSQGVVPPTMGTVTPSSGMPPAYKLASPPPSLATGGTGASVGVPVVQGLNQAELKNYNATLQGQGREIAILTNQVQIQSLQLDLAKKKSETLAAMGEAIPAAPSAKPIDPPKSEKSSQKNNASSSGSEPLLFTLTGTLKVKGKMVAFISNAKSDWTVSKGDMLPGGYRVVSISLDSMQIKNSEGLVRKVFPG